MTNLPSEVSQERTAVPVPPESPPVPTGPNDHGAQRAWEHYQVQRGIQRYQSSLTQDKEDGGVRVKRLDEIAPGNRIATDMIAPLVKVITAYQVERSQYNADNSPRGKISEDDWAMLALPAETLAACAILTAMASNSDATYTGVSRDCGTRMQHEIEYMLWKQSESDAARERKAAGADFVPNLFSLMVKRNDDVDMRVFEKWSKKAPLFAAQDWDQKTKVRIGAVPMKLLIESNGWYEAKLEHQLGHNKVKLMFRMTEEGLGVLSQLHNACEYQRPFMLPMICEPMDYEYIEPKISTPLPSEATC